MSSTAKTFTSKALLERILTQLDENKAEDLVTIDLKGKSEIADHMVVVSGRSSRQVTAMAEKLSDDLKHEFAIMPKLEGRAQGDWILLDAGDVIVHIFRPEVREFYQIEKLWQGVRPAGDAD
ncbi:MAG TPA: ribosome silencing factor [Rhodobacteraceae bacterium]|nr:ribosome silencing factor [Paracoccaceae bacterium]